MAITKHKISNLNKCITEAQQFISALHRQFWLGAVMCRFSSQILIKMITENEYLKAKEVVEKYEKQQLEMKELLSKEIRQQVNYFNP